jgi:glucan 1,3-beta-glucosidase
MEEGSGGFLNDLVFYGGLYGVQFGNQQYTVRNLTFVGCQTAIKQLWNWGWTYKTLNIIGCDVGIDMANSNVGGVTLLDSTFTNVNRALITDRNPANKTGQGSFVMENVRFVNVPTVFGGPNGTVHLAGNSNGPATEPGYAMVSLLPGCT